LAGEPIILRDMGLSTSVGGSWRYPESP
jgi:hypothetical protein